MKKLGRKFAKLLSIELESLEEDLEIVLQTLDDRLRAHEITDYVRNENHAVLRNEILGLRDLVRSGEPVELGTISSISEAAELARIAVRRRLEEHDYVPALCRLIEKRIDKVAAYLELESASR